MCFPYGETLQATEDFIRRPGAASKIFDLVILYPFANDCDIIIRLLQQLENLVCFTLQCFDIDDDDPLLRALEWPPKSQKDTANSNDATSISAPSRICPDLGTLKLGEMTMSATALESMLRSQLPAYLDDQGDGTDPCFLEHVEIGAVTFTDEDSARGDVVLQWLADAGEQGGLKFDRCSLGPVRSA